MNLVDRLLQADVAKVSARPTGKMEIKRLSKLLGFKFEITIQAMGSRKAAEIQRMTVELTRKGQFEDLNLYDPQIHTLLAGIVDPDLKDTKVLEHFGAATPAELIPKLFLAGEISNIKSQIEKLTGYDEDQNAVDEKVKN
jgi:hypothetical protein